MNIGDIVQFILGPNVGHQGKIRNISSNSGGFSGLPAKVYLDEPPYFTGWFDSCDVRLIGNNTSNSQINSLTASQVTIVVAEERPVCTCGPRFLDDRHKATCKVKNTERDVQTS